MSFNNLLQILAFVLLEKNLAIVGDDKTVSIIIQFIKLCLMHIQIASKLIHLAHKSILNALANSPSPVCFGTSDANISNRLTMSS